LAVSPFGFVLEGVGEDSLVVRVEVVEQAPELAGLVVGVWFDVV
jgi:hypothetical protein